MADHGADFSGIEYRFTDTDNILFGHAPSAIDDPVKGVGGPVEYKHIESIFIPRVYTYLMYKGAPSSGRPLDLEIFLTALAKVGEFLITETDNGVVIHGYKT